MAMLRRIVADIMSRTRPELKHPSCHMLGRLPPLRDDRTLRLTKYLSPRAVAHVPDSFDWHKEVTTGGKRWGMLGNDRAGDCVLAAAAHQVMVWTANTAGAPAAITDKDVLDAYSDITGYDPAVPSSDNGTNMLAAENYFRGTGIAGHKIEAFAAVDLTRPAEVRAACWLFGGVRIGLDLPAAWEDVDYGGTWKGPVRRRDMRGKWAPGSWGGHAVVSAKYTSAGHEVVTWGDTINLTPTGLFDYGSECFCALSHDWFNKQGHAPPDSVDWATLQRDIEAINSGRHW